MASIYNENLKITLFGESHQDYLGVVIDNLSAGIRIDLDFIKSELKRRHGEINLSTKRVENDEEFEIISGYLNGFTTGSPLCILFRNKQQKSEDYQKGVCRPAHADYANYIKHNGYNDYRGGGHSSGRLTAPIVAVGAICKQILKKHNITIASHVSRLKNIKDESIEEVDIKTLELLAQQSFPVINNEIKEAMKDEIKMARANNNSVGGIIETIAINIEAGIGSPFFDSLESDLSRLIFSVPAVKGIEFGLGFDFAKYNGSEVNDSFIYENKKVKTKTNNNGGINGGISNGMPIVFRCVIKPTPSIEQKQESINLIEQKATSITIKGRHDSAIISRCCVIIEAMSAICILNHYMEKYGYEWTK